MLALARYNRGSADDNSLNRLIERHGHVCSAVASDELRRTIAIETYKLEEMHMTREDQADIFW